MYNVLYNNDEVLSLQVLLETLRMHPPVFGIGKETPPEGLTVGGYHIPGGTHLVVSEGCIYI